MSAEINDILNKILSAFNNSIEKVSNLDTPLEHSEKNLGVKFKEIENELQRKASLFELTI